VHDDRKPWDAPSEGTHDRVRDPTIDSRKPVRKRHDPLSRQEHMLLAMLVYPLGSIPTRVLEARSWALAGRTGENDARAHPFDE